MLMILSPTRELAQQIAVEAASLSTFHKFSVVTLVGKSPRIRTSAFLAPMLINSVSLLMLPPLFIGHALSTHVPSCSLFACKIPLFHCFFPLPSHLLGGTNIESDKRALGRDTTDIIVGTPGK